MKISKKVLLIAGVPILALGIAGATYAFSPMGDSNKSTQELTADSTAGPIEDAQTQEQTTVPAAEQENNTSPQGNTPVDINDHAPVSPNTSEDFMDPNYAASQTGLQNIVTVTAFQQISLPNGNTDCEYTYSNNTTYRWHWSTVDGSVTHTSGTCAQSDVGTKKIAP